MRRLGDLAKHVRDSTTPTIDDSRCYVGLEHLISGNPSITGWASASSARSSKFVFRSGDVLYGKLRPYLDKAALAEFDGVASTDLLVLRPHASVDSRFLVYTMHSRQVLDHAIATSAGVNHPRTSWAALSDLEVYAPPLEEQRRIARILSAIQNAAEAVRTGTVCRRSVADSLADTVFAPYLDRTWKTHSLGDVTTQRQYGLSIKGGAAGSLPILRMTNLSRGVVTYENLQYVDMPTADAEGYVLRPGDILFNRTNSPDLVGRVGIVERSIPSVFASYLIRVVCDEQVVLPEFLNAFLNWAPIQARLRGMATRGVSQANISASTLATVEVPVPALDAQLDVIRAWRAAQRAIEASLAEGGALTRVFKSAQAALFASAA